MKRSRKREDVLKISIISALFFSLLLTTILLSSCTPSSTYKQGTKEGLTINLVGNPLSRIKTSTNIPLTISLSNRGDVIPVSIDEKGIYIQWGIMPKEYLSKIEPNVNSIDGEEILPGTKRNVYIGSFKLKDKKDILKEMDFAQAYLTINYCYPYSTLLHDEICIEPRGSIDEKTQVCVEEPLNYNGQNAPVGILSIIPYSSFNNSKGIMQPIYDIDIVNYGYGAPFYRKEMDPSTWGIIDIEEDKPFLNDYCENIFKTGKLNGTNNVRIRAKISDIDLVCDPEIVTLVDGKGSTRCRVPEEKLDSFNAPNNFYANLFIRLDYDYIAFLREKFIIS